MTPAERARLIDKQEFEAECRAIRARALSYVEHKRRIEAARIAAWLGRQEPPAPRTAPMPRGRTPKLYTHNGSSKTLTEWSIEYGVNYRTLARRIRSGMDFGQALTMKHGARAQLHTVNGVSKTLQQWADHIGVSYDALMQRLQRHSLAEAVAIPAKPRRWRGVVDNLPRRLRTGGEKFARDRA